MNSPRMSEVESNSQVAVVSQMVEVTNRCGLPNHQILADP